MSSSTWDVQLIEKRNKKIVEKYIYLYDVKRMRFDDVMFSLQWEHFFLTERTIKEILRDNKVELPYRAQLKQEYKGLSLKEARNNKLIKRFDYLFEKKRMRIDDALEFLRNEEFFLQPTTIEQIVTRWSYYEPDKELTLFD